MGLFSRRPKGVPPAFAYQQREELYTGPAFTAAPDDNSERFYDLNIGWHHAPDPIRQSQFWAEGNKIHPQAQMNVVSNLAIGSREAVMENEFRIGKLLGYLHVPMYAGAQQPSVIRANIQEAVPTTYGNLYEVEGVRPAGGEVLTPTGFQVPFSQVTPTGAFDGYPY